MLLHHRKPISPGRQAVNQLRGFARRLSPRLGRVLAPASPTSQRPATALAVPASHCIRALTSWPPSTIAALRYATGIGLPSPSTSCQLLAQTAKRLPSNWDWRCTAPMPRSLARTKKQFTGDRVVDIVWPSLCAFVERPGVPSYLL